MKIVDGTSEFDRNVSPDSVTSVRVGVRPNYDPGHLRSSLGRVHGVREEFLKGRRGSTDLRGPRSNHKTDLGRGKIETETGSTE